MSVADQGFGTSISFSSGFLALITNLGWSGLHREAIKTTHMLSTNGWDTFLLSDITDAGELSVDLEFDPDDSPKVPIKAAAAPITVTFPIRAGHTTAATWVCSGGLTDFDLADPMDDKMTATAKIKFSGEPTFTPGS